MIIVPQRENKHIALTAQEIAHHIESLQKALVIGIRFED
jgi:hypothetical protein